jgi:hypothetical protein
MVLAFKNEFIKPLQLVKFWRTIFFPLLFPLFFSKILVNARSYAQLVAAFKLVVAELA